MGRGGWGAAVSTQTRGVGVIIEMIQYSVVSAKQKHQTGAKKTDDGGQAIVACCFRPCILHFTRKSHMSVLLQKIRVNCSAHKIRSPQPPSVLFQTAP